MNAFLKSHEITEVSSSKIAYMVQTGVNRVWEIQFYMTKLSLEKGKS